MSRAVVSRLIKNRRYLIASDDTRRGREAGEFVYLGFVKGAGKCRHHMFRSVAGGWLETFTDTALLFTAVREIRLVERKK